MAEYGVVVNSQPGSGQNHARDCWRQAGIVLKPSDGQCSIKLQRARVASDLLVHFQHGLTRRMVETFKKTILDLSTVWVRHSITTKPSSPDLLGQTSLGAPVEKILQWMDGWLSETVDAVQGVVETLARLGKPPTQNEQPYPMPWPIRKTNEQASARPIVGEPSLIGAALGELCGRCGP
jgi:hypothetical protein